MKIWGKDVYINLPKGARRERIMLVVSVATLLVSISAIYIAWSSLKETQNTSELTNNTLGLTKTQINLIYRELQPKVVLKEKIRCPTLLNYGKFDTIKLVNLGSLSTNYALNLQGKYLFFRFAPTIQDFEKIEWQAFHPVY